LENSSPNNSQSKEFEFKIPLGEWILEQMK
jgi:hypothetical protein